MSAPTDKDTAAREMLGVLRLLCIQGHVPSDAFTRWDAALRAGEPGTGRLDAIRGVLAEFDWEHDDRQYALEKIAQIANGSRTESGIEPGGSAHVSAADLTAVLGALADAADLLAHRALQWCDACTASPCDICGEHAADLEQADVYRSLTAKLGGAS